MTPDEAGLRAAEERLRQAVLVGDVAALDRILDDRLVFTGPLEGNLARKPAYVDLHRTGHLRVTDFRYRDLRLLVQPPTGTTWCLVSVTGELRGVAFSHELRYCRNWLHQPYAGWRLIAVRADPL
ncbi:MAG TPA: nuclear transport factor 2 family protein [Pilimelia sp.]|nr:nuclear transport factor 2 family protein [Pilimelia sp.]